MAVPIRRVAATWIGAAAVFAVIAGAVGVPASASTKPVASQLKVMEIYDGSGPASFAQLPQGAIAAVKAINKSGGIRGAKIKLILCNTNNDPNKAASCGRLAVASGVIALVGSSTQYATQFLPLMVTHDIADIGAIQGGAGDYTSAASFPIAGGPPIALAALPYFLALSGQKKISLVRPDLAAAAAASVVGNLALKPFGIQLNADVSIPTSASDLSSYVSLATAGGTTAIAMFLPGQQAVSFLQSVKASSPSLAIGMGATQPGAVVKALGSQTAGIVQTSDFVPLSVTSNPTNRQFLAQMKSAGFRGTGGFQEYSWLAVRAFATMAQGVTSPVTSTGIFTKISGTTNYVTGVTPPLNWTKGGAGGIPRGFNACQIEVKLTKTGIAKQAGKFMNPFTNKVCASP